MTGWLWFLLALALLVAVPPLIPLLLSRSRGTAREQMTGRMLRLADGMTRVSEDGLPGRPVAVLVHGLTTPAWVFDAVSEGLTVQGWRVVRYDLWGRGGSATPFRRQDRALFLRQLEGVIEAEAKTERVLLVGYSMGATICADYAEAHLERVRGLVMLAPAGLGHRMDGFTRFAVRSPVIGSWLWACCSGIGMRRNIRQAAQREGPSSVPDITRRLEAETRTRGYRRAVLSSLRHTLSEDLSPTIKGLAAKGVPMLAVWGSEDRLIEKSAAARLWRLAPDARQVQVPDAGHGMPHTHPRAVLKAIREFSASL